MNSLEREIKKIKNLRQNQGKSEEELTSLAKTNLEKQEIISSLTFCTDDEERKYATNLLENYLAESSLEKFAERDTLRQLIDTEIVVERIKKYLNTEHVKANPAIPTQMLDQLATLNKQVIEFKDILGLSAKEEQKNTLEQWEKLKNKALNYYKENAGCNVVKCPECQKLFYILKDITGHTTAKIPFFKRTLLYNKKLYELYEQQKLTMEEMTVILGVSPDYITYIFENVYKNDR